jgi:nicotinamidase-related amidase
MQQEQQQPTNNNNRHYEELKMMGPPLYGQGDLTGANELFQQSCTPPSLDASRTALVIVDVQPEYWSECPAVRQDFPHFPSRISSLIDNCRSKNAKCIWVRADYSFENSPWLQQFSRLHKGRIPPIVKPSSEWEAFAEPRPEEYSMTKRSWSSTTDTRLLHVLKESGIDTVLVCGLITSVCVQHSAFGIFEAGFRTILVTDACADRGKARHEAALALYGDYMYELRTTESIARELRSSDNCSSDTAQYVVTKTADAMSTSSTSTTSLSTMGSSEPEDTYELRREESPSENLSAIEV